MIDFLITLLKLAVALLPFVLFCLLNAKANLKKQLRSRQFAMPVLALVYCFVIVLLTDQINEWLLAFLDWLPRGVASLAGQGWLPGQMSASLYQFAGWLRQTLSTLNLPFWVFFLANAAILLVYLLFKLICLLFMRGIRNKGGLHEKVAGLFYEYFPQKDVWYIQNRFGQTRSFLKFFYYGAVCVSSVLMIVSRWFYMDGVLENLFYPVFGVILLGELYFYLDGMTRREYLHDVLGEDEEAAQTVNYSLLRKFLRALFPDKVLAEDTTANSGGNSLTSDEVLERLAQSDDPKLETFASFMKAFCAGGFEPDHDYLQSAADLLCGRSILFNNPFYWDFIPYIFYPMNRTLLRHKKVLVVLGRHAVEEDVLRWLEEGFTAIHNIPSLWKTGLLTEKTQELDVGVLTRSSTHNLELHEANAEFFAQVEFVVILEPSKLVTTAQVGLNSIVKKCRTTEDKQIVYCSIDKNCDGLVDSLSHILMTSLTEVSATVKPTGTENYMCWGTDGEYWHHRMLPNIARYLGIGTELSFAGLKNQVSQVSWYGGEAFPVRDIQWIGRQYYYELLNYAGLPTEQDMYTRVFHATSNYWSAGVSKNAYITVEDEACNMFEVLRNFATRASEQSFINVISEDYLLKDYMAGNAKIFETDPKAIPCIVGDYARTGRNVTLRLLLMMTSGYLREPDLKKELALLGRDTDQPAVQFWHEICQCYLPVNRRTAVEDCAQTIVRQSADGRQTHTFDITLIRSRDHFNLELGRMERVFFISNPDFIKDFVSELKSASYIAEDERGERNYLGAELQGQVFQRHLPGQFFTFDGKYYEMLRITPAGEVLVRRAADHITGRPSYRQIRRYQIRNILPSDQMGDQTDISGFQISREYADLRVETDGYFRMERYHDFRTAKKVTVNGIPAREYRNKMVLRLDLPETEGKPVTPEIRATITLLINEVFRTLFAENSAFLTAVSRIPEQREYPLTASLESGGEDSSIYFIEDSQLDLGLLIAAERNIHRILEIVCDYLNWHFDEIEKSKNPPERPTPPDYTVPETPEGEDGEKEKPKGFWGKVKAFFAAIGRAIAGFFRKIGGFFKNLFKRKKKPEEEEPVPGETPAESGEAEPESSETPAQTGKAKPESSETPAQTGEAKPESDETPAESGEAEPESKESDEDGKEESRKLYSIRGLHEEAVPETGSQIDIETEDEELIHKPVPARRTEPLPYHERYYLLYGFAPGEDSLSLDLVGTREYLNGLGFGVNPLSQARGAERLELEGYDPQKPGARFCDFCGAEIFGVEYETLKDGRDRCMRCGATAIKTGAEFTKIFHQVLRNMESFYGIRINASIKVKMVNSKRLNKMLGRSFVPTGNYDGRVLGVAIHDRSGYTLVVENGAPRVMSMMTMAHELTHIWQYLNWDRKAIVAKYGAEQELEVYEGMAEWVEIQYAILINEQKTANIELIRTLNRNDEYGRGLAKYLQRYPFYESAGQMGETPFLDTDTPM